MRLLRIARGTLRMALTWGVAWAVVGVVRRIVLPGETGSFPTATMLMWSAVDTALWGALGGTVFALLVGAADAGRFARLRAPRVAAMGAAAALLFPLEAALAAALKGLPSAAMPGVTYWVTTSALGAASALGVWWLARRTAASAASGSGDSGDVDAGHHADPRLNETTAFGGAYEDITFRPSRRGPISH